MYTLIGFEKINAKNGNVYFKLYFTEQIYKSGVGEKCFTEFVGDNCKLDLDNLVIPCNCNINYRKGFDGRAIIADISVIVD